jgi:hypothetical protein
VSVVIQNLPTSKHLLRLADVKSGKGNILAVDAYKVTSAPDLLNFIRHVFFASLTTAASDEGQ